MAGSHNKRRNLCDTGRYRFAKVRSPIIALSRACVWDIAKTEWILAHILEAEDGETCLCGHSPIFEICIIRNRITGKKIDLGSECVSKYLGLKSDLIFSCIKHIRVNMDRSLNMPTLDLFYDMNRLSDFEYRFALTTQHKAFSVLSKKQRRTRHRINNKVLKAVGKRPPKPTH